MCDIVVARQRTKITFDRTSVSGPRDYQIVIR